MKLIIDIDEDTCTRLFDNGVEASAHDREVIDTAIRKGTPLNNCEAEDKFTCEEQKKNIALSKK